MSPQCQSAENPKYKLSLVSQCERMPREWVAPTKKKKKKPLWTHQKDYALKTNTL